MIFQKTRLMPLLLILPFAFIACQKKSEEAQKQTQKPEEGSMAAPEGTGAPMASVRVPDDSGMQSILQTQLAIVANPHSDSLRRELGRRSIDAATRVIWTVGTGRVADPASAVALSNAERAAWADGNRWAGYLIEWQKNNFSTSFGSIQTQVPGSVIERKSMSDSMCVALVRTSLP